LFLSDGRTDMKKLTVAFAHFSNAPKTNKTQPRRRQNTQISNFMNIHPVCAELFLSGGRTDMKKLTVAFRRFFEHA